MNRPHRFDRDPAPAGTRVTVVLTVLAVAGTLALATGPAAAWPVSASAGYDFYTDYGDVTTHAAVAAVGAGLLGAEVAVSGLHYDNDDIGPGNGFGLGLGMPLGPMAQLRLSGTRIVGDAEYRAWRIKAGPLFRMPTGQSVGVYYTHDEDNLSPRSDGVVAEAGVPLVAGLKARASAGYAVSSEGDQGARGSVGLSRTLFHFVELSGDLGMAQNTAVGPGSPIPLTRQGVRALSLLGPDDDAPTTTITTLLGVRVSFP